MEPGKPVHIYNPSPSGVRDKRIARNLGPSIDKSSQTKHTKQWNYYDCNLYNKRKKNYFHYGKLTRVFCWYHHTLLAGFSSPEKQFSSAETHAKWKATEVQEEHSRSFMKASATVRSTGTPVSLPTASRRQAINLNLQEEIKVCRYSSKGIQGKG